MRHKTILLIALLHWSPGCGLPPSPPEDRWDREASGRPGKQPARVTVARVERIPERRGSAIASGVLRAETSATIQSEVAGVIVEVDVREGDAVKEGQVLLKIDPFQIRADLQVARQQLSSHEAEVAGQEHLIASSEAIIARGLSLKELAEAGQSKAEPARARIDQLDASIKATRMILEQARMAKESCLRRVEAARAEVRRGEDLLLKATVRSPLSGVVVELNVSAGDRAFPGILSNPQANLLTIADLSAMRADLEMDETEIANVQLGQPGRVEVEALPLTPLSGRVIEIRDSPAQGRKPYRVVLSIDAPPPSLRPGMNCQADITTRVGMEVLVVPIQSLITREVRMDPGGKHLPPPPGEKEDAGIEAAAGKEGRSERKGNVLGVFLAGPDRRVHFRPVKTGIVGETDIEVLEGLSLGEEVVVGPLKVLRILQEDDIVEVDRAKPFQRMSRKGGTAIREGESLR